MVLPCLDEAGALPWVLGRLPDGYRAPSFTTCCRPGWMRSTSLRSAGDCELAAREAGCAHRRRPRPWRRCRCGTGRPSRSSSSTSTSTGESPSAGRLSPAARMRILSTGEDSRSRNELKGREAGTSGAASKRLLRDSFAGACCVGTGCAVDKPCTSASAAAAMGARRAMGRRWGGWVCAASLRTSSGGSAEAGDVVLEFGAPRGRTGSRRRGGRECCAARSTPAAGAAWARRVLTWSITSACRSPR